MFMSEHRQSSYEGLLRWRPRSMCTFSKMTGNSMALRGLADPRPLPRYLSGWAPEESSASISSGVGS